MIIGRRRRRRRRDKRARSALHEGIIPGHSMKEDYAARGRKTHLDTHVERKQRASTRAVDRALGCYSYRLGDTDIPSIGILAVARV